MKEMMGIQARVVWEILFGRDAALEEPEVSYGDPERLDLLSARELFDLLQKVQEKLQEKGYSVSIARPIRPLSQSPRLSISAKTIASSSTASA